MKETQGPDFPDLRQLLLAAHLHYLQCLVALWAFVLELELPLLAYVSISSYGPYALVFCFDWAFAGDRLTCLVGVCLFSQALDV